MKRFYKTAGVQATPAGHAIVLDGKSVKTPLRAELTVPTEALAAAIAAEWQAQDEEIDPDSMPLMRHAATAVDRVAATRDDVVDQIAAYGGHDLLCYRAEEPALAAAQAKLWQPLLDWAENEFDARLEVTEGLVPIEQPPASLEYLRARVAQHGDFELAALHTMTSLTGSLVLALAMSSGRIDSEAAWQAVIVDEVHQEERWGTDREAAERRQAMFEAVDASMKFLTLCRSA